MSKHVTRSGIYDNVPYLYSKKHADSLLENYEPYERAARGHGVPQLGSGLIYPFEEDKLVCTPFKAPPHYRRIIGLDFGTDHPFAAVGLLHDTESDVIYVARTYKEADALISTHVAAIKPWGDWIPVVWPHDGHKRQEVEKGHKELADMYRETGLKSMWSTHATHATGNYEVAPGIHEIWQRMKTQRFRVFSTEEDWLAEFRMYHRKEGQIVKLNDDLMDATRVAVMMRRYAIEDQSAWDELGGDPRDAARADDAPITGY